MNANKFAIMHIDRKLRRRRELLYPESKCPLLIGNLAAWPHTWRGQARWQVDLPFVKTVRSFWANISAVVWMKVVSEYMPNRKSFRRVWIFLSLTSTLLWFFCSRVVSMRKVVHKSRTLQTVQINALQLIWPLWTDKQEPRKWKIKTASWGSLVRTGRSLSARSDSFISCVQCRKIIDQVETSMCSMNKQSNKQTNW